MQDPAHPLWGHPSLGSQRCALLGLLALVFTEVFDLAFHLLTQLSSDNSRALGWQAKLWASSPVFAGPFLEPGSAGEEVRHVQRELGLEIYRPLPQRSWARSSMVPALFMP
jgi:hypothetical protein